MKNSQSNKPSATELTILKVLWRQFPLSAREIHQVVEQQLQWSFSSTRKTLDRMQQKGLLNQKEVHGVKVYLAAVNKVKTLALFVKELAYQVFEVEKDLPVTMFADSKLLDKGELEQLEQLLKSEDKGDE